MLLRAKNPRIFKLSFKLFGAVGCLRSAALDSQSNNNQKAKEILTVQMSHHQEEVNHYEYTEKRPVVFEVETEGNVSQAESREKLKSADASYFLISIILVLLTGVVQLQGYGCQEQGPSSIIAALFYVSLVWLVYLTITLIIKYSQERFRKLFRFIDLLVLLAYLAIWVGALVSYYTYKAVSEGTEGSCAVTLYLLHCYVILGWVGIVVLAALVLLRVLKLASVGRRGKHDDDSNEYVEH